MKNKRRNVTELQSVRQVTRNRWLLCGLVVILHSVAFSLMGGIGLAQSETLDRIVAVVNSDIILYSELEEQVNLMQKVAPGLNLDNPKEREQFERETLQRMVRERLAEQEVKRLNINVDKRDIDNAVQSFKKENGFTDDQLKYVLQQQGKTLDEFRENIKKQLERSRLIERVLKSKTVVTDEQVDAYLQSNPVTGVGKERRHLAVILLPFSDKSQVSDVEKLAQDIYERLKKGEDFARLAKQYSQGPAAQ
ncbi:MAG: SurA N-terminal domain-containing protein, partial [Desulforhabdus sp.]|nr:SurA N-terminal domain-containing protein [Desulforhabdus sp.]